jgi:hypothetical protein
MEKLVIVLQGTIGIAIKHKMAGVGFACPCGDNVQRRGEQAANDNLIHV